MDDPSYKRLLKHARIVKDLLIGFIAPQRAPGWAGALDFDTLQEGPTEEITDELRRRLGDVGLVDRPVAWRSGTEMGREAAIDSRVRGGKRSVGGED